MCCVVNQGYNLLPFVIESLLALKKEKLMAIVNATAEPAPQDSTMDDEFAAFQVHLAKVK